MTSNHRERFGPDIIADERDPLVPVIFFFAPTTERSPLRLSRCHNRVEALVGASDKLVVIMRPPSRPAFGQLCVAQLVLMAREDHVDVLVGACRGSSEERVFRVTAHDCKRRLQCGQLPDQPQLAFSEI